jgi:NAD(P)-dependent dehydrogenase (short-subunit alcohol dehydrogenase family)
MDINLMGCVYLAKYASIEMAKNKPTADTNERGVIIFVSSIAAEEGWKGNLSYCASKGALNGMLMPMSRDLGRYNIRVANIAPGFVFTPMNEKSTDAFKKVVETSVPLGRAGDVSEISHMVKTIVDNTYINGVRLRVDGGIRVPYM